MLILQNMDEAEARYASEVHLAQGNLGIRKNLHFTYLTKAIK